MRQAQLKTLKRGEFFRRTATSLKTYTRGAYQRDMRRYQCDDQTDISRAIYLKGSALVWVGFTY